MSLPLVEIFKLIFQATPLLQSATDIVKKVRKETNTKIHEVETSLEYKIDLLEKRLNEQIRLNKDLAEHLEETSNALVKVRKSVVYVLILSAAAVVISVIVLIITIVK